MRGPGINGEGELTGQPANPGSSGKMAVKTDVCVCVCDIVMHIVNMLMGAICVEHWGEQMIFVLTRGVCPPVLG